MILFLGWNTVCMLAINNLLNYTLRVPSYSADMCKGSHTPYEMWGFRDFISFLTRDRGFSTSSLFPSAPF